MKVRHTVEWYANLSLIVTSLLVCCVGVRVLAFRPATPPASVSVSPASGSSETAPGNYNFASHGATLILAIRQGCEFCERSMGFYAALARADDRIQSKVHLLACLPDKPTVAAGLLRSNNVPVNYRAGVDLNSLGVTGTPTLILVDSHGIVQKSWLGQLSKAEVHLRPADE